MSTALRHQPLSVSDYLEGERVARRKHEYVAGDVYAMAGGNNRHHRIATNATVELGGQLRGKPCEVLNSDTKIRIRMDSGVRFYYPDVSVACDLNEETDHFQDAPVVIIEVLSQSTRRTDEKEKCDAYLSIPALRVYALMEQDTAGAVVYRRGDRGFDRQVLSGRDVVIPLPEIDCQLDLGEIYRGVQFPAAPTEEDMD